MISKTQCSLQDYIDITLFCRIENSYLPFSPSLKVTNLDHIPQNGQPYSHHEFHPNNLPRLDSVSNIRMFQHPSKRQQNNCGSKEGSQSQSLHCANKKSNGTGFHPDRTLALHWSTYILATTGFRGFLSLPINFSLKRVLPSIDFSVY